MSLSNSNDNSFELLLETTGEIGYVSEISHPIISIDGLPGVKSDELIIFETGEWGQVFSINEESIEILAFSGNPMPIGTRAARMSKQLSIPLNNKIIGKTLSPLGNALGSPQEDFEWEESRSIHRDAPGINERVKIEKPLITGVSIVDLLVPLGKGQRELILGDRKTGKTNFLLQAMLTQSREGTICIYAAVGKRKVEIRNIEKYLHDNDMTDNSLIVASSSSDPVGLIFITPYTAMTIAEYFKDQGKDVLLIIDDLSTHAKYYREISLIGKRFPGRSSYPGDIFYAHARLLERAGNFTVDEKTTASITCLPVAETVEGNISGYIQTNLMSITDGHIYFDSDWFTQGRRPSVNYFLSVTRVGRQTQSIIRWGINRELNTFLGFLEKTQSFVHFGAELNEGINTLLSMGEKIQDFFNQHSRTIIPINLQIILFSMIWVGTWQTASNAEMNTDMQMITNKYHSDEGFRKQLHDLIQSANDFNALLGKLSGENKKIISRAKS